MNSTLIEFEEIIGSFPNQIAEIDNIQFDSKPLATVWSKKEIVGHLIDSAIINYLRFVKAQFEDNPQLYYDQNEYCEKANYKEADKDQLCKLWDALNRQLLFLFKQIVHSNLLQKTCNNQTLEFLMMDYVAHLKHHRSQVLS